MAKRFMAIVHNNTVLASNDYYIIIVRFLERAKEFCDVVCDISIVFYFTLISFIPLSLTLCVCAYSSLTNANVSLNYARTGICVFISVWVFWFLCKRVHTPYVIRVYIPSYVLFCFDFFCRLVCLCLGWSSAVC